MAERRIDTDAWRIRMPGQLRADAPLLVVPTVHPRGDRRILRCAEAALDAGFRIHFIWLGAGAPSRHPLVSETLLPSPSGRSERIRQVARVARLARELPGAAWHIHDFYLLPAAAHWQRATAGPVLYDSHEYYGRYYAQLLPLPEPLRRAAERLLDRYEVHRVRALGSANLVAPPMAEKYAGTTVDLTITPNLPLAAQYQTGADQAGAGRAAADRAAADQTGQTGVDQAGSGRAAGRTPFAHRRWRVVHTGTLSPDYGTALLIDLAVRAERRGLPFEFQIVSRFPSRAHERQFRALLAERGNPANLSLVDPMPAHEVPGFLAQAGFGLALNAATGQYGMAIPAKSYEYVLSGLVGVITNLPAQRAFWQANGSVVVSDTNDIDDLLEGMLAKARHPEAAERVLAEHREHALAELTWERACAPALVAAFTRLRERAAAATERRVPGSGRRVSA